MNQMKSENVCLAVIIVAVVFYFAYYLPERRMASRGSLCSARKAEDAGSRSKEGDKEGTSARAVTTTVPVDTEMEVLSEDFYNQKNWPSIPKNKPQNARAVLDQKYTTGPNVSRTIGTALLIPGRSAEETLKLKTRVSPMTTTFNMSEMAADQVMMQEQVGEEGA